MPVTLLLAVLALVCVVLSLHPKLNTALTIGVALLCVAVIVGASGR